MIKITEIAEQLLEKHLARTAKPTKYIAGFRTKRGREIALERSRDSLFIWTEHLAEFPQNFTLRPLRHYPANKSRNSNLNNKNAPKLIVSKAADYWQLDSTESLQSFIDWYVAQ